MFIFFCFNSKFIKYDSHILELTKKCEFHQESESQLKSQVTLYTQKYEEFQATLSKSNEVFESFRAEMDKLTKKIKKLENETAQWKHKFESSDANLQKTLKLVRKNINFFNILCLIN